jgi:hypothetical protein
MRACACVPVRQSPIAFLVCDVVEVVFIALFERAFVFRFNNGSVLLFQAPRGDRMSSAWLPEQYAAMSAGVRSICLLNTAGHVSCMGQSVIGLDRTWLLEHRAHVQYSQISCGASFTCGLRANDSRVECFGMLSSDKPLSLNSSALTYRSIATQRNTNTCVLCRLHQHGRGRKGM